MKIISGNPNLSDTDDLSKLDAKVNGVDKGQRKNGLFSRFFLALILFFRDINVRICARLC
jgi:hypothetical protein